MTDFHVTKRTRPDLDWRETPKGFYVADELVMSDAYRSLTKTESDLLLFILTRRKYPEKKRRGKKGQVMDYWSPTNGYEMAIPYVAIRDFFHKPRGMKKPAPTDSTVTKAIKKLMHVGFLSISHLGGNGKGDQSYYRLEHNWRVWREGDPACFTKGGMSRGRGFCQPGSKVFCPAKNTPKKLEKGVEPA